MKLFKVYSVVFLAIATIAVIGIKGSFAKIEKPQVNEVALVEGKIDQERYLTYSEQNFRFSKKRGRTVLFFAATKWCSTCSALEKQIKESILKLPVDITILKVDYDNDKIMNTKYAVTQQTTLLLFDSTGKEIKRWIGTSFDDLLQTIK
jgi:thioredoxin-related protein